MSEHLINYTRLRNINVEAPQCSQHPADAYKIPASVFPPISTLSTFVEN